jgi:hypothetical protein
MPSTPTLIVEDSTGTERFRLDCVTATATDALVEMWSATATVDRADWLAETFDEVTDRFRIERGDGTTLREGRYQTDERDGNTVTVTVTSYEQDAKDAEPTAALKQYQNVSDDTVAGDAIDGVPTLSRGTIESGASAVSFSFAHAPRAKQLRDAAQPGGMDLRYNPDRSVDFLQRLGSDKPSIAISNTDQSIVESLSVTDDSQDPVTHIRGLGAQQGDDQVTYETAIPSYSPGDRQVWREYVNKDIVNEDRLQTIVDRLATEYDTNRRRLTVKAGVLREVDVGIGDSITVDIPEMDIDQLLRVVRFKEIIDTNPRYLLTLTNRDVERGGERKARDDLERYNKAYEGFIDRDNDSYGWQPVNATNNAVRPYEYPSDVVSEKVASVIINSRQYRAYSAGGAAGGDHSHLVGVTHPTHDHDVNLNITSDDNSDLNNVVLVAGTATNHTANGSWQTIDFIQPSVDTSWLVLTASVENTATSRQSASMRLNNTSTGFLSPDSSGDTIGLDPDSVGHTWLIDATNVNGETVRFEFQGADGNEYILDWQWFGVGQHNHLVAATETSDTALGTTVDETSDASGDHTHPPEPGLIEFSDTASNVDLLVNGSVVASDVLTGVGKAEVDIRGELTAGSNTIEARSDTLGLLNLTVVTQLFRSGASSP